MKIKYKFTTLFDINPNYHEITDYADLSNLVNYLISYEGSLNNGEKLEISGGKYLKNKVKLDELHFNDKLIWHYRNGFTHDWELFKLSQQIKN